GAPRRCADPLAPLRGSLSRSRPLHAARARSGGRRQRGPAASAAPRGPGPTARTVAPDDRDLSRGAATLPRRADAVVSKPRANLKQGDSSDHAPPNAKATEAPERLVPARRIDLHFPEASTSAIHALAEGCLGLPEAVRFSGLSRSTLYAAMEAGELPFVNICRTRLLPPSAV